MSSGRHSLLSKLKRRAGQLKSETYALYLVARHPETPLVAKVLAAAVAAYALSPIDLIPDFVPVLGYVDDLILIPAGIALTMRLVPVTLMEECRNSAASAFENGKPVSRAVAAVVAVIWVAGALTVTFALLRVLHQ